MNGKLTEGWRSDGIGERGSNGKGGVILFSAFLLILLVILVLKTH